MQPTFFTLVPSFPVSIRDQQVISLPNLILKSCRQKDLENFLDHTRAKFVGLQVQNDSQSLAGLPPSIHEGVKVLKQVRCEIWSIVLIYYDAETPVCEYKNRTAITQLTLSLLYL